jgi:hypothetical protein
MTDVPCNLAWARPANVRARRCRYAVMKFFSVLLLLAPSVSFALGKCEPYRTVVPGCGDTVHCQLGFDVIKPGTSGTCSWAPGCQHTQQLPHNVGGNIVGWQCMGKVPDGANPNDFQTQVSFTCCKLAEDDEGEQVATPSTNEPAPAPDPN